MNLSHNKRIHKNRRIFKKDVDVLVEQIQNKTAALYSS